MNTTTATNQLNGKATTVNSSEARTRAGGDEIHFDNLVVVVPQSAQVEEDHLSHQLLGTHEISVLGYAGEKRLTVTFDHVAFEMEGVAGFRSAVETVPQCLEEGATGVIDIGGLNTNISVYSSHDAIDPMPGSRTVNNNGIQNLIEAIVSDVRFIDLARQRGTRVPAPASLHAAIVREEAEGRYMVGGGASRFSFEELFNEHVATWSNRIMADAEGHWNSFAPQVFDDLQRIVVIGGGASILGRLKAEQSEDTLPILFPPDPQLANVKGCLLLPGYGGSTLVVDPGNHFLKVASDVHSVVLPSLCGVPNKATRLKPASFQNTKSAYRLRLLSGKVFDQYRGDRAPEWILGDGVAQHSGYSTPAYLNGRDGKTVIVPRMALFAAFLTHLMRRS